MTKINEKSLRLYVLSSAILWMVLSIIWAMSSAKDLFVLVHTRHTKFWDSFFWGLTYLGDFVTIGPVLLLILFTKFRSLQVFYLLLLTQLIPVAIVQLIKFGLNAPRPSVVYGDQSWFHRIEGVDLHSQLSFPSGHTAGAFAFFSVLCLFLPQRLTKFAVPLFVLAFFVGYSRMYLGQHHFEDVYAGGFIGTLGTVIGYLIWRRWELKKNNRSN
jgi:membrane-associated phospholipid phosphatase